MRYKCLNCNHIASTRSSSGCPKCGKYNIQEIPDEPSKKPEYTPLEEEEDISEKDPISKKSSEKDSISKKSYSSNKSHCISSLAGVVTKPFKAVASLVKGSKKAEYVG